MKYEKLPQKVLIIWEFMALIVFAGLFFLLRLFLRTDTLVWDIILWLLGAAFILCSFLYLPLLYISCRYAVLSDQVIVKRGVIFNKTHYLKRELVSFVSVYRNPFTRLLDISTLVITAPGASVFILFMSHRRAMSIAKQLSRRHKFEEEN